MGSTQDELRTFERYYDPMTKVISMPKDEFKPEPRGLGYCLYRSIQRNSNKIAQVDSWTNESYTYGEYLEKCVRTAMALQCEGVTSEDVVMSCSYNHLNSSVPFVATHFIGATSSATDPSQSKEDIAYLLKLVNPKVIFVCKEAEDKMTEAMVECNSKAKLVVYGETSFESCVAPKLGEENFKPYETKDLNETCIILFSSGTTGLPKGITLSHKFALYHAHSTMFPPGTGFASLYWSTSTICTLSYIVYGKRRVNLRHFDANTLWEIIDKHEIDAMFMAPSDFIRLMRKKPENRTTFIKTICIGGSGICKDFLEEAKMKLPTTKVLFGYGLSELYSVFCPINHKSGSVGIPYKGKSYKIVDIETGDNVGFNQTGELCVKTEWVSNGYYRQDSSSVWDDEGYLKTGDVVYYDEDFCFYVVDRIKEMFKYRSWHIVPAKIETIILKHPGIDLCGVVGIPHPEDDCHALAVVQLREGSDLSPEEIKEFVERQVDDRHKLRAGVRIMDKLPLTPSAKIRRRDLVTMYVNGEI
ncbi:PREDICTED: luciferin 4-monooxygenase-like [Nicrophorus vespilloides]|uniref:Luciferin 4-monooxygenase-like n=1 Tax=Nicrophorus vespilloides TaxID=110193 RepID=A0ABM1MMI0_NICVS|nr:PREDICTED: luciferin 4-monooxygenase-like [Nicrophorus vespilloides]